MARTALSAKRFLLRPQQATATRALAQSDPLHVLANALPEGAKVLEIGAGAGLFLGLLAMCGRYRAGEDTGGASGLEYAADTTGRDGTGDGGRTGAYDVARAADLQASLDVTTVDVAETWPDGRFDVVSMLDSMHLIPRHQRAAAYGGIARRLPSGGLFVYRDVGGTLPWRAMGSRMQELAMAREWTVHEPIEAVEEAMSSRGFDVIAWQDESRLWYGHGLRVFRKG